MEGILWVFYTQLDPNIQTSPATCPNKCASEVAGNGQKTYTMQIAKSVGFQNSSSLAETYFEGL
jgi:hypothetical protein